MTPKSTCSRQSYKSIENKLKLIPFNKHALRSGFKQRKAQKLTGKVLLMSFLEMALQGNNSFQMWAEKVGSLTGKYVSKQAIWKRITSCYINFLVAILADVLRTQISQVSKQIEQGALKNRYKRILIQDSTSLALPSCLRWCFPGNTARGERKAQIKIQVIYDLLNSRFIYFELTPFTANDQSKSKDILHIAGKEDLVIRDLGYFSLDCFDQLNNQHTGFVSRLKYGVKITDLHTGKEINLLAALKTHGWFDRWVCVGEKQQIQLRLVAVSMPQEQAGRRRQKAKQDRDLRLNHTKEYYELLGYSLFITTEDRHQFNARQIVKIYGLRWRIESIFKCWKSQFHLQKIIPQHTSLTKERTEAILYMMLIFILLFQVAVFNFLLGIGQPAIISLTKLSRYIATNITSFLENNLGDLTQSLLRYCKYDMRKDRLNYLQKLKLG
jgi:hypothetical protein